MHKHLVFKLILLSVTLFQLSCEPELVSTIDLPHEDPKLVMNAYLEANQEVHSIFIGRSTPNNVAQSEQWYVTNAVARISDGVTTVTLQHDSDGYYSFRNDELAVLPGKQYSIVASAPGFPLEISSTCTIPEMYSPQFAILSFDSTLVDSVKTYTIKAKLLDVSGSADFYLIRPSALVVSDMFPDTMRWNMYPMGNRTLLFDDKDMDGQWVNFAFQTDLYQDFSEQLKVTGFEFGIFRTDEAYYRFNYPFESGSIYNNSPFSEPIILYTNINNGYGVFCGLVKHTFRYTY